MPERPLTKSGARPGQNALRAHRPGAPWRALVGLLLALALVGCEVPPVGWHRLDLTQISPRVEPLPALRDGTAALAASADGEGRESTTGLDVLGAGIVNRHHPPAPEPRLGARVFTRTIPAGQALRWTLPLGRRPRLSFVPASAPATADAQPTDCRLRYRAAIREGDRPVAVLDHGHRLAGRDQRIDAPAPVEISLGRWARRTVELILWAESENCSQPAPDSVWASPSVYGIGPVPSGLGSADRPNVLLLGLDTLRADHLGAYGRTPSPSPAFDRMAETSDLWLEAFSTFNVTNPSFASIHTGLYGKNHGIYTLYTPLPEEHRTLAEHYREAGYRTHAVVAAGHLRAATSGLDQGFEQLEAPPGQFTAETVVDQGIRWLSGLEQGPFFLWLHFFDPHTPHTPPQPWADGLVSDGFPGMGPAEFWRPFRDRGVPAHDHEALGGHRDLYTSEVAYFDRQLDRLLDFLDSRQLLENTWIVLVADHGENLGEQGIVYQHAGLWDATLHVPLLVRPPGPRAGRPGAREGRRFDGLVQSIDLYPTLLRASGLEKRDGESLGVDGRDLYSLTTGGASGRRVVFAEEPNQKARMVRDREHLYLWTQEGHAQLDGPYLFRNGDLSTNLAGQGHEAEERLRDLLDRWWRDRRPAPEAGEVFLAPEEREQLEALGYVDP